jgi:RHS repeat-associated protein
MKKSTILPLAPSVSLKEVRADGGVIASGIYRDVSPNHLFWQADSYAVGGAVESSTFGNGLTCDRVISPVTGRLQAIATGIGAVTHAQYHTYGYDLLGQVTHRRDMTLNREETFTYDDLNRLVSYNINDGPATTVTYDALGNITQKSDVGNYYYSTVRPHAVTAAGALTYTYDNNGNQTQTLREGVVERMVEWSVANQVEKITNSTNSLWTTFRFGAGRERIVQEHSNGTKTIYIGDLLEIVTGPDDFCEEKYHVYSPEGKVATRTLRGGSTVETRYYHTDGLGSIVAVSDEFGRIEKRFTYDPWGQRDMPLDTHAGEGGGITRGFTDHEHLDDFGLIHMNGRVFDPVLARFLSADPFVQDIENSQCYNRYSYCLNNPLVYIDPSGEIAWMPIIIGAILGAYSGGTIANEGKYNPTQWDFNSSTTWRYMGYGAAVGAVSGYVGGVVAASEIPMANTAAISASSFVNSVGTYAYTGGQTPVSMSVGIASYDFTNKKFGYLGKGGNEWYENTAYAFGALANLSDTVSLAMGDGGNININAAETKNGWWSHSSISDATSNDVIMSIGPGEDYEKWSNLFKNIKSNNTHFSYADSPETWKITLMNISKTALKNYEATVTKWNITYNGCAGHVARSLWTAGVPTAVTFVFWHPYVLNTELLIRQTGIYSSPYLYQY